MPNKIILTEQMRQQEDERYAELLNNLRECKILEESWFQVAKSSFPFQSEDQFIWTSLGWGSLHCATKCFERCDK